MLQRFDGAVGLDALGDEAAGCGDFRVDLWHGVGGAGGHAGVGGDLTEAGAVLTGLDDELVPLVGQLVGDLADGHAFKTFGAQAGEFLQAAQLADGEAFAQPAAHALGLARGHAQFRQVAGDALRRRGAGAQQQRGQQRPRDGRGASHRHDDQEINHVPDTLDQEIWPEIEKALDNSETIKKEYIFSANTFASKFF